MRIAHSALFSLGEHLIVLTLKLEPNWRECNCRQPLRWAESVVFFFWESIQADLLPLIALSSTSLSLRISNKSDLPFREIWCIRWRLREASPNAPLSIFKGHLQDESLDSVSVRIMIVDDIHSQHPAEWLRGNHYDGLVSCALPDYLDFWQPRGEAENSLTERRMRSRCFLWSVICNDHVWACTGMVEHALK